MSAGGLALGLGGSLAAVSAALGGSQTGRANRNAAAAAAGEQAQIEAARQIRRQDTARRFQQAEGALATNAASRGIAGSVTASNLYLGGLLDALAEAEAGNTQAEFDRRASESQRKARQSSVALGAFGGLLSGAQTGLSLGSSINFEK